MWLIQEERLSVEHNPVIMIIILIVNVLIWKEHRNPRFRTEVIFGNQNATIPRPGQGGGAVLTVTEFEMSGF